jgi:hypothetical protein
MNRSEPELDPFTEALRLDLPSPRESERVRSRLVSAGVLAGTGAVAPSVAATTGGGLLVKLGALPTAAKLGGSMLAIGVAALPVWDHVSSSTGGASQQSDASLAVDAAPARAAVTAAGRPLDVRIASADLPKAASVPVVATPRPAPAPARSPRPLADISGSVPLPSVGAFPVTPSEPIDEGTLRAETAVMERALAALRRGDHVTARRELATHSERFPNGHLKPDRERAFERLLGKETQP